MANRGPTYRPMNGPLHASQFVQLPPGQHETSSVRHITSRTDRQVGPTRGDPTRAPRVRHLHGHVDPPPRARPRVIPSGSRARNTPKPNRRAATRRHTRRSRLAAPPPPPPPGASPRRPHCLPRAMASSAASPSSSKSDDERRQDGDRDTRDPAASSAAAAAAAQTHAEWAASMQAYYAAAAAAAGGHPYAWPPPQVRELTCAPFFFGISRSARCGFRRVFD